MANTPTTDKNTDMLETAGQLLRTHREKLGLSVQEIAKRIYLDVKIIEAIEEDNAEEMSSPIYVRGYLRSYAKIVDADADNIIERYNVNSPPPIPKILPEVKPPTQISSNDKPVKAFTYLVTLGLVLLLLIWYQSNFVVETKPSVEQVNSPTLINGVDVTYKIVNHPDTWQFPNTSEEDIETQVTSPAVSEDNNLNEEDTKTQIASPAVSEENNLVESQEINKEKTSDISTLETTDTTEIKEIADTIDKADLGTDTIEMILTSDSWIEIYDANNKRLFFDLAIAGKKYNIKGTAPFNVELGYAKGVALKFNGKPINKETYSKSGVAHLTLPR